MLVVGAVLLGGVVPFGGSVPGVVELAGGMVPGDVVPGFDPAGGIVPGVVVVPGVVLGVLLPGVALGAASGVVLGVACGVAVPGVGEAVPGVGEAVPGVGRAVPGVGVTAPGVVCVPCEFMSGVRVVFGAVPGVCDVEGVVCPGDVAVGDVVVPVCGAALYAIRTVGPSDAVGPLPDVEQWSAIFVTLLTWNEFVPAALELLFPAPMLPAVPVRLLVAPA